MSENAVCNIARIVIQIELNNFGWKNLSGLVETLAGESAADINRCKLDGQVSFLVKVLGEAGALAVINEQLGTDIRTGEFVLHSAENEGYWCNGFGWVYLASAASGLSPREVVEGHARLVFIEGKSGRDRSTGWWWTKSEKGLLRGIHGLDFYGPFATPIEGAESAISTLGIRPPCKSGDVKYVIASKAKNYDLEQAA